MADLSDNLILSDVAALNELDDQIEALQGGKRELIAARRDEHGKRYANALKNAVKLSRMDSEKRAELDETDAETFRILTLIETGRAPRATPAREIIEEFDPVTGEIHDDEPKSTGAELSGEAPRGPAVDEAPHHIQESQADAATPASNGFSTSFAGTEGDIDRHLIPAAGGDTGGSDSGLGGDGLPEVATALGSGMSDTAPPNSPETATRTDGELVAPVGNLRLTSECISPVADGNPGGENADCASESGATIPHTDKPAAGTQPAAAPPGVVYMERCPPAGVERHPFQRCFPERFGLQLLSFINKVEVEGVRVPIVKIGDQILDGWMRYLAARELKIEYPVVQYAGADPLLDMIQWNLSGGRMLATGELKSVATKLSKLPGNEHRASEIFELFGLEERTAA
jgi:hypothetical protein